MSVSIATLLDALQKALEDAQLWQSNPPSAEKMMSTEPFSIDTLTFTQWLQWVYIARLRALLDAHAPMPTGAQVFPYAEEVFKADKTNAESVLMIIKELDDLLR